MLLDRGSVANKSVTLNLYFTSSPSKTLFAESFSNEPGPAIFVVRNNREGRYSGRYSGRGRLAGKGANLPFLFRSYVTNLYPDENDAIFTSEDHGK